MRAGPLNKDDDFTELADLDGLVNSARVQAGYTSNATSVGSFVAFSGTFGEEPWPPGTSTLPLREMNWTYPVAPPNLAG